MVSRGFWDALPDPIIGLSPMDGVTDAPFRSIVAKTGKPSFMITEFVNVEGLSRGATSLLSAFKYSEAERPIVAQIYGIEEDSLYNSALIAAHLGFDGIDLNMGCPARKVARRGSGAGLIAMPETAKKLIRIAKRAAEDFAEGMTLEKAKIRPKIIKAVKLLHPEKPDRRLIPVSVKTRIGYDAPTHKKWIGELLKESPAAISLHGRTLKQMYSGRADWNAIGEAAEICKGSGTLLLGNGDITSVEDAKEKIKTYGVDGVLIGRAVYGNPWIFTGKEPDLSDRIQIAIEHSRLYEEIMPERHFWNMRKHLAWYVKGFPGAGEVRKKLMKTDSSKDVEEILGGLMEAGK